ncbi:MAG: Enoyl-CoA hydratase, partial [uncultured Acidimicrobiales bacterium]
GAASHPLRGHRPRRPHHPRPPGAAERLDREDGRGAPLGRRPGGARSRGEGHRPHRRRPGFLCRRRHRSPHRPRRRRHLRRRAPGRARPPRLRRPARLRPPPRLPPRAHEARHRRRERGCGRRRLRARLLRRHPLRRRGRQAHHELRSAGAPRRVGHHLAPPPPRRSGTRRRAPLLVAGRAGRGGRADGARQPGPPGGGAPGRDPCLRPRHGHRDRPVVPPRAQGPAVGRPAPAARGLHRPGHGAARVDDRRPRLQRGRGRAHRAAAAAVL